MNIFKRGNIWWCKFRVDNKLYQYSCKTKDKAVAQEVAAAIHGDTVRNKFDIPAKFKAERIFVSVFDEYLKNQTTEINRRKITAKHFMPFFKDKQIADITRDMVENYQLKRKLEILSQPKNIGKKESEISFRSVNYELVVLHHFFNYCIKKGYIDKNPASGIKKLNELSRLKTLSDSDIDKLIAGATNKLTRDLITFLIYTGCRKGEALTLILQ